VAIDICLTLPAGATAATATAAAAAAGGAGVAIAGKKPSLAALRGGLSSKAGPYTRPLLSST